MKVTLSTHQGVHTIHMNGIWVGQISKGTDYQAYAHLPEVGAYLLEIFRKGIAAMPGVSLVENGKLTVGSVGEF